MINELDSLISTQCTGGSRSTSVDRGYTI